MIANRLRCSLRVLLCGAAIGAGQNEVHTVKEYVDLAEFANGCRLAVALATAEG